MKSSFTNLTKNKKPKVFLGGTCNNSTWRQELIKYLTIDYFNPVVDDWTSEHQQEEIRQREICDILLYVITPKMAGVYAIAELTDDANNHPEKTIFVLLKENDENKFTDSQFKSLLAVANLCKRRNAEVYVNITMPELAAILNARKIK